MPGAAELWAGRTGVGGVPSPLPVGARRGVTVSPPSAVFLVTYLTLACCKGPR